MSANDASSQIEALARSMHDDDVEAGRWERLTFEAQQRYRKQAYMQWGRERIARKVEAFTELELIRADLINAGILC